MVCLLLHSTLLRTSKRPKFSGTSKKITWNQHWIHLNNYSVQSLMHLLSTLCMNMLPWIFIKSLNVLLFNIVPNKYSISSSSADHWTSVRSTAGVLAVSAPEADNTIPIIICAAEERMGATMATINSIYSNTDAEVFFYIVTLRDAVKLTRFASFYLIPYFFLFSGRDSKKLFYVYVHLPHCGRAHLTSYVLLCVGRW